jgi:hypothetical protein
VTLNLIDFAIDIKDFAPFAKCEVYLAPIPDRTHTQTAASNLPIDISGSNPQHRPFHFSRPVFPDSKLLTKSSTELYQLIEAREFSPFFCLS